jgi:subtilisin family serine protease
VARRIWSYLLTGCVGLALVAYSPNIASGQTHESPVNSQLLKLNKLVHSGEVTASTLEEWTNGHADTKGIEVTLHFDAKISGAQIKTLSGSGVTFHRHPDGAPVETAGIYPARIHWDAISRLHHVKGLEDVQLGWSDARPLGNDTIRWTGALGAQQRSGGDSVTGKDVVVAIIDSGMDVLHPAFFYADGGEYQWNDNDGDGVLTPGTDTVEGDDFANSPMLVADGDASGSYGSGACGAVRGGDGHFDPRADWIFADLNGDGGRNAGEAAGFDNSTPAFGEPIFVGDDQNGNGQLDAGEPLVRLKTSKIRKSFDGEDYYYREPAADQKPLISVMDSPKWENSCSDNFDDGNQTLFNHSTLGAGIIAGGQASYHDTVGMAPDAEIVHYGIIGLAELPGEQNKILSAISDLKRMGDVDVVNNSWGSSWFPTDGTGPYDKAFDELRAQGTSIVFAAGNENEDNFRVFEQVEPGESYEFPFSPNGFQTVAGMIQYTGDHGELTFELIAPDGKKRTFEISKSMSNPLLVEDEIGDTHIMTGTLPWQLDQTDRGNAFIYWGFTGDFQGYEQANNAASELTSVRIESGSFAALQIDEIYIEKTDPNTGQTTKIHPDSFEGSGAVSGTDRLSAADADSCGNVESNVAIVEEDSHLNAHFSEGFGPGDQLHIIRYSGDPRLSGEDCTASGLPAPSCCPQRAFASVFISADGETWGDGEGGGGALGHIDSKASLSFTIPGTTIAQPWTIRVEGFSEPDNFLIDIGKVAVGRGSIGGLLTGGPEWVDPTTNFGTVNSPGSADSSFAVGAADRVGSAHQVTYYSVRGPRIDGHHYVDIVAPAEDADHALSLSPTNHAHGATSYARVSAPGTSFAAPHVSGAVALLREKFPSATVDELESRLTDGARPDVMSAPEVSDVPNRHWGHGYLDVYGALYGEEVPDQFQEPTGEQGGSDSSGEGGDGNAISNQGDGCSSTGTHLPVGLGWISVTFIFLRARSRRRS